MRWRKTKYNNLKEFLDAPGRVGLVVEGGGMRATPNIHYLDVLARHGYTDRFSVAAGSSAGAGQIAYFISSETDKGISLGRHVVHDRGFVKLWRLWSVMHLHVLYDILTIDPRSKLNYDKIRASKTKAIVTVTRFPTFKAAEFPLNELNDKDMVDLLVCGTDMPAINTQYHHYKGKRYMDGMLSNPLPVDLVEPHVDRILVIRSTRQRLYTGHSKIVYAIMRANYLFSHKDAKEYQKRVAIRTNNNVARLDNDNVFVIYPSRRFNISAITTNKAKVERANSNARRLVNRLLSDG